MAKENLNNVLVTGGDSFIGYHIVSKIVQTNPTCKISVLDLPTSLPRFPSVQYHDIDICDKPSVLAAIKQIQPQVIFHAACTYSLSLPAETHTRINLHGTLNVLEATQSVGTVKALVFHSSTSVIEDGSSPVINATEDLPVLLAPEQKFPYPLSKALAEQAVLSANRKHGMVTVSLRPASCFGEANEEMIEKLIGVARSGRGDIQMGDGTNLYDFVYVENVADAHLLAAKALLRAVNQPPAEEQRVDGEAFHLTNDEPWLFWDFTREVAKQAGYEVKKGDIKVVPRWVGMSMAFLAEWSVWIVSGGKKEPGLTRYGVRYSCFTRTISCEKAKRRLGYRPAISMQVGIERSVKWFLVSKKDSLKI
jgi:sterol-4alpha-carboxylate 3-dehydrogenase (decarboxylating)